MMTGRNDMPDHDLAACSQPQHGLFRHDGSGDDSFGHDGSGVSDGRAAPFDQRSPRRPAVGDDEDVKYARHAVGLLRSKRSSSFAMDGFTGSTNGHFGTSYGGADKPKAWKRQLA